ncbi:Atypical/RIO/RIO1 protein kinase [Fonticula alba]|uniref:Serine/threonine-protein kinase RIO1 n=1 Tax=Fonticula alba TaxID=691883 RepID=A0A058Z0G6_FONAL|nr:Atypical/RIO/RIO1 protein kinase [Fonticula alba]KCV67621.1 Atypical/RIO/RIO1 protein kinase [Fonticula alba]|eukprot:XP_009497959.1 Atypical/RIO/RIO1 protein kinase [Fonticula alba]
MSSTESNSQTGSPQRSADLPQMPPTEVSTPALSDFFQIPCVDTFSELEGRKLYAPGAELSDDELYGDSPFGGHGGDPDDIAFFEASTTGDMTKRYLRAVNATGAGVGVAGAMNSAAVQRRAKIVTATARALNEENKQRALQQKKRDEQRAERERLAQETAAAAQAAADRARDSGCAESADLAQAAAEAAQAAASLLAETDSDSDEASEGAGVGGAAGAADSKSGLFGVKLAALQERINENMIQDFSAGSQGSRKAEGSKTRHADKANRATTEQVLDPRTRMILFKMLSQGIFYEINGCVSTGKEANVYHALTGEGVEYAVKVYKTSILVFKDRDKYVTGEYRFRHGYGKNNPRQMVKTWAEKEMRNLKRLVAAGIPCPDPVKLRNHVLVMTFIGKNGWPGPRLKDAQLPEKAFPELYMQLVRCMRTMYRVCRLVHADLSEYNIIYYKGILYIIDVSQSVEHDHPYALDFLRKDIENVTEFFKKRGHMTTGIMSRRELFDFITGRDLEDDQVDAYLARIAVREEEVLDEASAAAAEVAEEVFMNAYIPRNLFEVIDVERDVGKVLRGDGDGLIYRNLTGLQTETDGSVVSASGEEPAILEQVPSEGGPDGDDSEEEDDDEAAGPDSDDEDGDSDDDAVDPTDKKAQRKAHKKAVKEANREKRQTKTPKHLKKRREKEAKKR